jgi:hypothetical protein
MYYVIHRMPLTSFFKPPDSHSLWTKTNTILDTILVKLLASTVRRTTKSAPTSHIDARIDQLLAFDNRSKSDPVKVVYRQEIITFLANSGRTPDSLRFLLCVDAYSKTSPSGDGGILDQHAVQLSSATATGNIPAIHFFFASGGGTTSSSHLLSNMHFVRVLNVFYEAFRAGISNGKIKALQFLLTRFQRYMVSSLSSADEVRYVVLPAIHDAAVSRLPEVVRAFFRWAKNRLGMSAYDARHAPKWKGQLKTFITSAAQTGYVNTTLAMLHEISTLEKKPVNPAKAAPYEAPIDYAQEAFYVAYKHGQVDLARELLDQEQVEISEVSHKALYTAARYQRRDIVDVLLEFRVDINEGMPIYTAVDRGYVLTTLHFLRRGANISRELFERCEEKVAEMAVDSGRLVAYYLVAVQCDASWNDPVTRSFLDDIRDSEGLRSMVIAALETNMD